MVTAPYNFVPLSSRVCKAEDLGLSGVPSQDNPEEGALSGTIPFTLTCDTPLLVGADGNDGKEFIKDPVSGEPIIPGSSIRGMIRGVLEIASFARMGMVDDQRVGVRDLNAPLDYRNHMSGTAGGGYAPRSYAGYLRLEGGRLILTPCEFARVDHSELDALLDPRKVASVEVDRYGKFHKILCDLSDNSPASIAQYVEKAFYEYGGVLPSDGLFVQSERALHKHSRGNLIYRRAATSEKRAQGNQADIAVRRVKGRLVFTGMPSDKKHMEFYFFGERADLETEVKPDVWRSFISVHEAQEKETLTWAWRKEQLYGGEPIPVFWLGLVEKPVEVKNIGLAMMFKLAADNSIHEMIGHTSGEHLNEEILDLPTRIFGRVANTSENGQTTGFRTRVSFGWAQITSSYGSVSGTTVMARPKPSFVPSYVRQKDFAQGNGGDRIDSNAQYRSYMNWNHQDEEVRGWKRYPAGKTDWSARPVPQGVQGAASTLRWIKPEGDHSPLEFKGRIRFHNLHPTELGALLWALTWGGNSALCHRLGMGKPFGWGQVRIEAGELNYVGCEPQEDPVASFRMKMETWAGADGWESSQNIRQLKAMASREIGATQNQLLEEMKLVVVKGKSVNHFLDAKKDNKVLPEYPMWPDGSPVQVRIGNQSKFKKGDGGPQPGPEEFSKACERKGLLGPQMPSDAELERRRKALASANLGARSESSLPSATERPLEIGDRVKVPGNKGRLGVVLRILERNGERTFAVKFDLMKKQKHNDQGEYRDAQLTRLVE